MRHGPSSPQRGRDQRRFGQLLLRKEELAKPNEYYRKIHPTEADEVDGRLATEKVKAEAKAKAKAAAAPKPTPAAAPKPASAPLVGSPS